METGPLFQIFVDDLMNDPYFYAMNGPHLTDNLKKMMMMMVIFGTIFVHYGQMQRTEEPESQFKQTRETITVYPRIYEWPSSDGQPQKHDDDDGHLRN